jgi:hypothetical protein
MVGSSLYYKNNKNHWISYIVGLIIWGACLLILNFINKKYYGPNYSSYSSFNLNTSPTAVKQQPYSGITVPTGFNQPKQSFFGKMFSSSSNSKPINYSPQITVPTAQNTQPKQSFFDRMFKKSPEQLSATVPQSSASSATVPQSSASSATVPSSMMAQNSASSATVPQSSAIASPQ